MLNLPQLACLLSHMLLAINTQFIGWKRYLFQDGVASLQCWLLDPSVCSSQDELFLLHLKPGCSCSIVTHNMLWEQMSLSHAISGNDTEEQVLLQNMEIFLDIFWAHRKSQKNINRKPSQDVAAIGQKPFILWNHESQPVLTLQPCSLMSMPLCMVSFPSGSLLVSSFGKEEMAVIRPEECPARVHPHHCGCQWQSAQPSGRLENYERIEGDGVLLGDASILQSFVSGWDAHHADNNFVTRL